MEKCSIDKATDAKQAEEIQQPTSMSSNPLSQTIKGR
jgi:hypothetical protein